MGKSKGFNGETEMMMWSSRKYSTVAYVLLEWGGEFPQRTIDAMDGLNVGHALWRARNNWHGAKVTLRWTAAKVDPTLPN